MNEKIWFYEIEKLGFTESIGTWDSSYQGRKKMHARKNLLGKPTTPDLLNDRFVNGINAWF